MPFRIVRGLRIADQPSHRLNRVDETTQHIGKHMNLRTTLVLLAACSIALATTACDSGDSDGGSAAAADVTVNPDPSDSSADTDAAASDIVGEDDSTQTGPEDVPAVDPCESDPCATAPGPECGEDGTVMTFLWSDVGNRIEKMLHFLYSSPQ